MTIGIVLAAAVVLGFVLKYSPFQEGGRVFDAVVAIAAIVLLLGLL